MDQRLIAMLSDPYISDVGFAHGRQEKSAANWKTTHEQALLESGLTWPPNLTRGFLDFRSRREGEVAFFADIKFPASTDGWQFFDAVHPFERTFRWPCKPEDLRNPWQTIMPTLCAKSSFVCRKKHTDGSVALKRLHGLESMRVIGWDKAFWKDGASPFSNDEGAARPPDGPGGERLVGVLVPPSGYRHLRLRAMGAVQCCPGCPPRHGGAERRSAGYGGRA